MSRGSDGSVSRLLIFLHGASVYPCKRHRPRSRLQSLVDQFNRAIDSGDETLAQQLVDTIATSPECGRYQVAVQRRLAAQRLNIAQLMMARGRPVSDYEHLLTAAQAPEVLWQASATVGEVRFGERRFVEAAQAYDLAIEIIKNETLTPRLHRNSTSKD